jgi:hypothetical protein
MPKFYINFRHGGEVAEDDEGIELQTLEEAREVALTSARELLADSVKSASDDPPLEAVIITDESGRELMTISAKEALPEPLK